MLRSLLSARLLGRSPQAGSPLLRSLAARCSADGRTLPATFRAPETVNMDDYPPPTRKLSKGARSPAFSSHRLLSLTPRTLSQTTWRSTSCAAVEQAART